MSYARDYKQTISKYEKTIKSFSHLVQKSANENSGYIYLCIFFKVFKLLSVYVYQTAMSINSISGIAWGCNKCKFHLMKR